MKKLLMLISCLVLTACAPAEKNPMAVAEELLEYRDMTYGEFKEETGVEAEMLHANRFYASIPDTEYTVVFLAEKLNEEEMVYELEDSDKFMRVEGSLKDVIPDFSEEMTPEEFISKLSETGAECSIEEGAGTAYYVGNKYVVAEISRDGQLFMTLHISMNENDKIAPDSCVWLM